MWIYILLYITIGFVAFFISAKQQRYRKKAYLFYAAVIFAALMCGLRDMLGGYDSYIYGDIFDTTAEQLRTGYRYTDMAGWTANPDEEGFGIYNILLSYVTCNRYIFFLITAILFYSMLAGHLLKYCRYPYLAFFFFFCLYYFFTYTYTRQMLAIVLVWYAIPYAIERKFLKFMVVVALAASFHNSALLFSFYYFIANRQFSLKQVYIIYAFSLLIGLTPIGSILMNLLGGAVNEKKASMSASAATESGARFAYIVEAVLFMFLTHRSYYRLPKDKVSVGMRNVFLSFIFVLLFFVRFTDGGRLSWYFIIGPAWACSELWPLYRKAIEYRIIMISVFSILYFRVITAWGEALIPYKTFFDKERHIDDGWRYYEYDHYYDKDKLYKLY